MRGSAQDTDLKKTRKKETDQEQTYLVFLFWKTLHIYLLKLNHEKESDEICTEEVLKKMEEELSFMNRSGKARNTDSVDW